MFPLAMYNYLKILKKKANRKNPKLKGNTELSTFDLAMLSSKLSY